LNKDIATASLLEEKPLSENSIEDAISQKNGQIHLPIAFKRQANSSEFVVIVALNKRVGEP
jgi:hypothetical protein